MVTLARILILTSMLIGLSACQTDVATGSVNEDDNPTQTTGQKQQEPKRGTLENLGLGVTRAEVESKLGDPEQIETMGSWQIAHHRFVHGYNRYLKNFGPPPSFQSSGNLLADILIVTVGSAISAAANYRSDAVLLGTKVVYDTDGKLVFVGGNVPAPEVLENAKNGDPAAQFAVQKKAGGILKWQYLCRSANAGYPAARVAIAKIYESGYPPASLQKSLAWHRAASDVGHQTASMYATETSFLMEVVGGGAKSEKPVKTECDPSAAPTKSLRAEPASIGQPDCEVILEAGVRERLDLIDRVFAGEKVAIRRLGNIYDKSADAATECRSAVVEPNQTEAWDTSSSPNSDQIGEIPDFADALKISSVRWYGISQHFSGETPDYMISEIRDQLPEDHLTKADQAAKDWINRFGASVDNIARPGEPGSAKPLTTQ
jgi:hypothetical protein